MERENYQLINLISSKKLQKLNNDYLLLNNLLEADRKEINERAKKILNYPFFPQKTKGIFSDPQSFLYSTKNSYAQIFSAGGSLKRMSIQETSPVNHIPENELEELSVKYLAEYAPYAKKCKNIYTHKNTELVYYVYCPVIQQGKNSFVDVTEPIKLAISISDGKLMAFDASHYLKTHSEKEYPEFPNIKQERTLSVPENLSPESSGYIYSKKGLLYCTKYKTNENKIVYRTVDANNDSAIYDERSFMLVSGII